MRLYITLFFQRVESINENDFDSWKSLDAFRLTDEHDPYLITVRSYNII